MRDTIQCESIIFLEPAEEGGYNAIIPALDGCFTQGETVEETLTNAEEAIHCYIEGKNLVYSKTRGGTT